MKTAQPYLDLQAHQTYRLAYNTHKVALRGVLVAFLGYEQFMGQTRAKVRVIGTDETYIVNPGIIISF